MYQRNLIQIINNPIGIRKKSATEIDHIITDYVLTSEFKTVF